MLRIHIHRAGHITTLDDFKESEHPRRPDGEFAPKGGGAVVAKPQRATKAPSWTKHGGGEFTEHELARLKALRVPPAWTSIRLSSDPTAKLQVVGVDAKGRTQRKYSAEHAGAAAAAKFARLKAFNAVAGKIVTAAQHDMFNAKLAPAQRDAAAVIKLIAMTGFRIGSDKDTGADVKAHGASTLLREHVRLGKGGEIFFNFTGKKGVHQEHSLVDHELHRYIKVKLAGDGDRVFDVTPVTVRQFLKARGGDEFKVKDFRTWTGTNEALKAIESMKEPTTKREFAKFRLEVGKAAAKKLGNTATMALGAYIDPAVFGRWSHLQ